MAAGTPLGTDTLLLPRHALGHTRVLTGSCVVVVYQRLDILANQSITRKSPGHHGDSVDAGKLQVGDLAELVPCPSAMVERRRGLAGHYRERTVTPLWDP
jgi:hypothetical protein